MSCDYANGLSEYEDKGVLGLEEKFDSFEEVEKKSKLLSEWIENSLHVVFHTGAGISTSVGIPDFRGPNGVWTLEKKGLKPNVNISFDDAKPSKTHQSIHTLIKENKAKFVISQNIDGLHLKSGLLRNTIAELHGNMFTEQCDTCNKQFVRNRCVPTVGQKYLNSPCKGFRKSGHLCRGKLKDTILDWEASLPLDDILLAEYHSKKADLSICLGTTLQIVPSGTLPLLTKKSSGKLVIVNLQPTKYDKKADLKINFYVDDVMSLVLKNLNLNLISYSNEMDPTQQCLNKTIEWTLQNVKSIIKK